MHTRAVVRLTLAFSAFLLSLVGPDTACFAQKTLVWKFPKSRVFDVVVEQDTVMKLDSTGNANLQIKETNTLQKTNLRWTVLDVNSEGLASVEQAIDRIVLELRSPAANFIIDTNDNTPLTGIGESIAKGIRPLAGARYIAKTRANGQVIDLAIPDDVSQKFKEGVGGLGEAGLREIAVNGTLQFPNKPVNVGDTWAAQYELDMRVFGKLIVSTTYQYLGEETQGGKVLDKIKATTAMKASDPKDNSGLKLKKQESSGTIWFDNNLGCIHHSEFQQEMAMDVNQGGIQVTQLVQEKLKLNFTSR